MPATAQSTPVPQIAASRAFEPDVDRPVPTVKLPWIATLVVGVLLSLFAAHLVRWREDRDWANEFDRIAATRTRVLRDELRLTQTLLATVQGFHEGSQIVERREESAFFRSLLGTRVQFAMLAWAATTGTLGLEEFEKTVHADGVAGFRVRRRGPAETWLEASPGEAHVPITVAVPPVVASSVLGWDLEVEPLVKPALDAARDTGEIRATPLLRLPAAAVAATGAGPSAVVVVQPVYLSRARRSDPEDRRQALEGYALAFLDVPAVVRRAFSALTPRGLELYLYDRSPGVGEPLLAYSDVLVTSATAPDPARDTSRPIEGLRSVTALPFAGRDWEVVYLPAKAFLSERAGGMPWIVLGAGLLSSLFAAVAVYGAFARRARVRQAVGERTREFAVLNEALRRDLASHRTSEAALSDQTERVHGTIESLVDGVVTIDAAGRVTHLNPVAEALTGWDRETARGCPLRDVVRFLDEGTRGPRPDLVETAVNAANKPRLPESAILVAMDGTERIVTQRATPIRDRTARTLGSVIVLRDVTEARRAEREVLEREALFRAISKELPDALFLIDPADPEVPGRILHANEAAGRLHGEDADRLVGRSIVSLDDPTTAAAAPERLAKLKPGETVVFESVHRRKDGTTFPVEAIARAITWGGKPVVLALDRDITERRRAEEARRRLEGQMQHSQRLESLGVLAGGIAHDFNNLLMGILGNADLALHELPKANSSRARVEDVKKAGQRASELTQQMLAYAGKGRVAVEPLDLNDLIRDMAKLLEVSISKRVKLERDFAPKLPAIEADAAQIRQIVMNLITNAAEAVGDTPGVVRLRTAFEQVDAAWLLGAYGEAGLQPGSYVVLEVSDTGIGMDPETQLKIFEPFFTTKFTGRGLGLAALLGIVRGHHGAVRFESAPGKGTTFRVVFPPSTAPAAAKLPSWPTADATLRGGTVLVIDDDPTVRDVVRRMLQGGGFQVLTAAEGREGVDTFRSNMKRVDAVILDMTMPGMTCEEVLREIRAARADARILVTSGFPEQDAITRFEGLGLSGFIQKPFERDALLARLHEVLEKAPAPPPK